MAASGTPIVAPHAGTITWVAYQASGAGYYVVLASDGEPYNYVFMHMLKGSIVVKAGDHVADRASSSARSARPATPRARTSTSRSGTAPGTTAATRSTRCRSCGSGPPERPSRQRPWAPGRYHPQSRAR